MPQGAVQQAASSPSMVNDQQMQDVMPASLSCVTLSIFIPDQGTGNPGTPKQPGWLALEVDPPPFLLLLLVLQPCFDL